MICVLLAAGYATRMYPLTENFPKPLLEIKEKTILDWIVDDLAISGKIDRYVVISNHKFLSYFEKWVSLKKSQGFNMDLLDDGSTSNDNRLGAVKDIEFAIDELDLEDDILVLAGDNVMDFSFNSFVTYFEKKKTTCIMRYRVPGLKGPCKFGVATIDENDKVLNMVEKPQIPESEWAVPPFYIYKKSDLGLFKKGIDGGCKTDAPGSFIEWLCKQTEVHAFEMPGQRFDVGSIEGYEKIRVEYQGLTK
ncbi:MAG: nucleotidyltransferase family protein [Sphaerochaeta sp.]|jgi:glucose-1-phosphate thymidylyltransferase|nr:nucleotidyltransferase family protein [Sphaerochaeta sp.]